MASYHSSWVNLATSGYCFKCLTLQSKPSTYICGYTLWACFIMTPSPLPLNLTLALRLSFFFFFPLLKSTGKSISAGKKNYKVSITLKWKLSGIFTSCVVAVDFFCLFVCLVWFVVWYLYFSFHLDQPYLFFPLAHNHFRTCFWSGEQGVSVGLACEKGCLM